MEVIKDVISQNDGYIMNFTMFSDLALSLIVEIKAGQISTLHEALTQEVKVSELDSDNSHLKSQKEWLIYMHISFSNGKGDLKQEIPAVPG